VQGDDILMKLKKLQNPNNKCACGKQGVAMKDCIIYCRDCFQNIRERKKTKEKMCVICNSFFLIKNMQGHLRKTCSPECHKVFITNYNLKYFKDRKEKEKQKCQLSMM